MPGVRSRKRHREMYAGRPARGGEGFFAILQTLYRKTLKTHSLKYRKIPKISPGAYIFQRPFLRGLFLKRLIFGGAYLRREICLSKPIGPAL